VPLESRLKVECREYIQHAFEGRLIQVGAKSWNGFPDSILFIPGCPPVFVEFKAPGKVPRKNQRTWGLWLTLGNFHHWLIDDWDQFVESVENLLLDHNPRSK
jgi:hypothetical protein